MVNELGEARYVRKLRGQSQLWNVVEAVLLGLVCAAFSFRMVALLSDVIQVCMYPTTLYSSFEIAMIVLVIN